MDARVVVEGTYGNVLVGFPEFGSPTRALSSSVDGVVAGVGVCLFADSKTGDCVEDE